MARYGKIPTVPAFEKIIYIGHSYGSIIGNALNRVYPHDVDATILTGFSCFFLTILPAVLAQSFLLPARIDEPSLYGDLDLGYLEFSNQGEFNYIFYYPEGSDENFANYDFSIRGTMTLGELASLVATGNTATGYTNPVLVASGQYDYLLCNELGFDLEPIVSPSCYDVPLVNILTGQNYLQGVADYYPDADFEWYVVPDAGHCWQFHYSAYEAFGDMHKWMASKGF
jgi:pimeloyl-ACP methyl ester carboxylesterase